MFVLYETPAGYAIFKVSRYLWDILSMNWGYVDTRATDKACAECLFEAFFVISFEIFVSLAVARLKKVGPSR